VCNLKECGGQDLGDVGGSASAVKVPGQKFARQVVSVEVDGQQKVDPGHPRFNIVWTSDQLKQWGLTEKQADAVLVGLALLKALD